MCESEPTILFGRVFLRGSGEGGQPAEAPGAAVPAPEAPESAMPTPGLAWVEFESFSIYQDLSKLRKHTGFLLL